MCKVLCQLRRPASAAQSKWLHMAMEDRRHGQMLDAFVLDLQEHGCMLERDGLHAMVQDWQRVFSRICLESWNVEELSQKASAAKVVAGKLEQEKLDALRSYAAELESLRGRLRQLERESVPAASPPEVVVCSSHAGVQQAVCDMACKAVLAAPSFGDPLGLSESVWPGGLHKFEGQVSLKTNRRCSTGRRRALSSCSLRLGQALAYARPLEPCAEDAARRSPAEGIHRAT